MGQAQSQPNQNQQNTNLNPEQLAADHWSRMQQKAQENIQEDNQPEQQINQEQQNQKIKQAAQSRKVEEQQEFNQKQQDDQELIEDVEFKECPLQEINQFEDDQNLQQEQQQQKEEIIEYSAEQIESIWLSRIFKIFVNAQEMFGKKVDFIAADISLTVEYLINEIFYSFITSKLFSEENKLSFLVDALSSLQDAAIGHEKVQVAEGDISFKKYQMLLNHIQENLVTCVLYPEGLEWQSLDENVNNLEDNRNLRASYLFQQVFCSSNIKLSERMLDNFLEYLENKASIDDAHKFLDLMLKRELYLNKTLSISNNDQQILSLQLIQKIVNYPKITEQLLQNSWAFGKFAFIQTGKQFQMSCLIGKILSISGFFTDGNQWQQYFGNNHQQMTVSMNSLRNRITSTNEQVCNLFTQIMKKSKLKHKFFEFIQKIIFLNLNLEKQFNQGLQMQCSTPGMVFNLQYILSKIFYPWIDTEQKVQNSLNKIDKTLISYIKKHPYFSQIYQNIDFLNPEVTPFIEPEEFSTNNDTMTVMFLLTLRVNHIVAATLDQYYSNYVLRQLSQRAQQYGNQSQEVIQMLKFKVSMDTQVLCPKSIQFNMDFFSFSSQLAMSLIDENNKPIYPFGLLPSSFVHDIHSFFAIYNYNDQALKHDYQLQKCCEFAAMAMNTRNIANPHLRIKGIELFHIFDENRSNNKRNFNKYQVAKIFRDNQIINIHIIGGLLKVVIDSERTGEGNQFYEKFSFRYQFCKLIRYLLEQHKDIYKDFLVKEVQEEREQFLAFANFYLNDMIYLLDECLSRMKEMKELEANLNIPENTAKHNQLKDQLKTYTLFLTEYYQNIQVFSEVSPEAFLTDEIRDKLVNNLNYTLEQLNGKQATQYKIQSFDSVNFDPKFIMGCVMELYLNFSSDEKFLLQVVKDERCFSIELFQRTINLIDKYRIIPIQRIDQFNELIVNLQKYHERYQSILEQPDDVPQDFLDPLCYSIMTDPVKLPHSNVIVDRLTIKKQLLNQQIDPFDRSPLTIDMVIEQPELKQKIAKYLETIEEVKKNKQKLKQQQE